MDTDGGQSSKRSVALFFLIAASLVAIAAVTLLVVDRSHSGMYVSLGGALITIYLNARILKRDPDAR
ncbi:hypothetical protein ASF82_13225 [Frigoribacterium sp. Leaf164]|uniref:hypothetical protein n=1 Tax=Frigoribacterium sp. Leaf164 TaxID=1736282 RepID=UPI0006F33B23|nr:hypothetical protein [Frigoribacterium sp. Leaf164]KQR44407.1 hypothetical protein ASF82_13225 [Frigoribacterium sp. Leaf164]